VYEQTALPGSSIQEERHGTARWQAAISRGGFEVDIAWQNGKVTNYRIRSKEPREVKIRVNGETTTIISGRL